MASEHDALQLWVFGFGSREVGDKLAEQLEAMGFGIGFAGDDTDGPFIETNIVWTAHLDPGDLESIVGRLRAVPGAQDVRVEYVSFCEVERETWVDPAPGPKLFRPEEEVDNG